MDIIRAWKDEEYRLSLTEEQRALLPDNPAGHQIELSDADLESVAGGIQSILAFCSGNLCNNFQSATVLLCL
jgi:mersacidin/lichenicidin family type 2 lantibiotic